MKEQIKKLSKFIASRMFYLILGISVAVAIPIAYAAWNSTVSSGQTLTTALWNDMVAKLVELNNKIDSWPPGSYCIFMGGGSCPTGFTQKSGYMRAISLYAANSSYIVPVTFGNSNIQCHGACGQYGNWIGELNLNICCK
ncbi:MAG: hypothetical protein Q8N21_00805 [bacterium]|nr:hypothetical protein [bacterium]